MRKKSFYPSWRAAVLVMLYFFSANRSFAQGSWTSVSSYAPDINGGVMILLSNGSVLVKSTSGGSQGYGNIWDILTPDSHGSYVTGTWTTASQMTGERLYFSSQVMRDGRVYVAGGEYGNGCASAEIYDAVNDLWLPAGPLPPGDTIFDANSEMLPDGRILQAVDYRHSTGVYDHGTLIYDPATNTFSTGPSSIGYHGEASWVKLADNSILFIDWTDTTSERYIPASNSWIPDAHVPVNIYDTVASETGPALLLPNGKAFVVGGNGKTAIYTPSGTTAHGSWVAGHPLPNAQGAPDAIGTVLPSGKVLLATSPIPYGTNFFPSGTSYYIYDYINDSFTRIPAPGGGMTGAGPCFYSHSLNLPDGNILYCDANSLQYYVFTPADTALATGKPTISNILKVNCDTYLATGMLFNGINEGSYYGDDWQMPTNYPLIRLTKGTDVYYARTYNWNRTGVMTGSLADSTYFVLPNGLPEGSYSLQVIANGNPSASRNFVTCQASGVEAISVVTGFSVFPNPAAKSTTVRFNNPEPGPYLVRVTDVLGRTVASQEGFSKPGDNSVGVDLSRVPAGVLTICLTQGGADHYTKLMVK